MNSTVAQCVMVCATVAWVMLSVLSPWVMGDGNKLLCQFVSGGGFISFLSVIVTITLASAANLHLELNKLEERINKRIFDKTRSSIRRSSYWLIIMLFFSIVLYVVKSLVDASEITQSFINGACLLIVLFSILTLADITQAVFAVEPSIDE